MRNSVPGPSMYRLSKEDKRKINAGWVAMAKGESIKVRKARAKETEPRDQPERELRNAVIKELRRRGVKVMRIENSIVGRRNTGIPDLWVVNRRKNIAGWVELKSSIGILTGNQPQFREDCLRCGVNHWVIRSVDEAVGVIV